MKMKRITYITKGFDTSNGPDFPLAPLDLLLEVVDLEDLKGEVRRTQIKESIHKIL